MGGYKYNVFVEEKTITMYNYDENCFRLERSFEMTEKELMKLQNGSDVRGIALEGVEGEAVNLRP